MVYAALISLRHVFNLQIYGKIAALQTFVLCIDVFLTSFGDERKSASV